MFILALSVFSGVTALAVEAAPRSLSALLPEWGLTLWSMCLVLGSATTLIGMLFQSVNGIITEQIGSVMVGVATIFYATIALWFAGVDAIQTVGIILAWGLACLIRWAQLQALLKDIYRKALESHVDDMFRQDPGA